MDLATCYLVLCAFEAFICFLAFPPVCWIVWNIFTNKLTHINFRILICYTIITYQFITMFRVSARLLRGIDPVTLFWPIVICNVAQHWMLNQSIFSVLLLTIERSISTMWSRYERCGALPSILILVLIAIGMLHFTITLELAKNALPIDCRTYSIAESQPEAMIFGWLMSFFPMLITGLIVFKLHKINTKRRQNLSNPLNKKFQFVENIYTTKCLVPISVISVASSPLVLPLNFYTMKYTSIYGPFDYRIRLCVVSAFIMFDFYCYFIIFYVIRNFPPIQARLNADLKRWGIFKNRIATESIRGPHEHQHNTQVYFNQLEQMWKT